jgi:threonine synthase
MPTHLRCSNPDCGERLDRNFSAYACPRCHDLLDVVVELPKRSPAEFRSLWRERRFSRDLLDRSGVWRFREFLPEYPAETVVSIWEGNTPIIPGQKALEFAGVAHISFKHLGWNPTGCFKDLGMTVAITEAKHRGKKIVACASTGNTAGSLAAYAARAGMQARVYLPKGKVSLNKLAQSIDYGAEIVEIEGNFDDALNQVTSQPDSDVYLLNSVNPFRIEGQKTAIFELMEQLNWEPPDYLVLPGGNLGNSAAFGKALDEMLAAGLIPRLPRMIIVQARGSNALVRTIRQGGQKLQVVEKPQTIATAISIGAPRSWKKALRALAHTNGIAMDVTDDEIMEAKRIIGQDGIGCEPASATTLAGVRQLAREGRILPDSRVVAILTGHVLKDTESILRFRDQQQATRQIAGVALQA